MALALIIDDAVVGAENIGRRMRQHRDAGSDKSVAQIVIDASHEMRSPLAYATLIALLAIVPVAIMEGRPGAFFEPLALAYALAVGAAMLVALTLTPALSLLLFSRGKPGPAESPLVERVGPRYDGALSRFVGNPRMALIAAGACVVVGLAVLPLLGTSVIPSFKDRDVLVHLDGDPGTSNPRMTQIATQLSRELRNIPGVENVGAHVGRAIGSDQRVDVSSGEVWASIDRDADYDKTVASIENLVDRVRSVRHDVVTYSTQKIRDVGALNEGENPVTGDGLDVLTGSDKPLAVRLFGQDPTVLRRQAARVQQVVSGVDGVSNPRVELPTSQANLEIAVDLQKARREGIKPGDVRRAEATLLQGIEVGAVFEDQKVFEVIVKGVPETRRGVSSVRNLLIDKPDGGHVRLGDVADVRVAQSPAVIKRDAVSRYVDVEADVSGRSVGDVANDIEGRLANVSLPLEYHAEVLQQTTGGEINTGRMLAFALGCAFAIFLLLQAGFGGWRLAVLAFLTLPVALSGGAVAALIDGSELSLGSLIGFLALLGIAARTGLVLVRRFQDLEHTEGRAADAQLVSRGARERLGPIMTTTVALALFALPFVIMGSGPGLEVVHPMAVVLLGGLVTTTFLSLFVLPSLYLRYGAGHELRVAPEEDLLYRWAGVEPEPAVAGADAGAVRCGRSWRHGGRRARSGNGSDSAGAEDGKGESGAHQPAV